MKKIARLFIVSLVVMVLASASYGAEYVVKPGDTLAKVARVTNHKLLDLIQMNCINNRDIILAGQKLTYVSEDDKLRARVWAERRRSELNPSDGNYRYFGWVLEDLQTNRLRYSINEPSGTHYSLILDFAKAQGEICRIMWRSKETALEGHGEWMSKKFASEGMNANTRPEISAWLECR